MGFGLNGVIGSTNTKPCTTDNCTMFILRHIRAMSARQNDYHNILPHHLEFREYLVLQMIICNYNSSTWVMHAINTSSTKIFFIFQYLATNHSEYLLLVCILLADEHRGKCFRLRRGSLWTEYRSTSATFDWLMKLYMKRKKVWSIH